MSYIIDRRLNSKNKSAVNRTRFLGRYRSHIKKAVEDAVTKRSITDIDSGENIVIPKKDLSEPKFRHDKGGKRQIVSPGNQEYLSGDKIQRPTGGSGSGSGSGNASNSGDGMDEFSFQITQEEFLEFLFEDLELPNLIKRQLAGVETFKFMRAGIVSQGTPAKLNIVRSLRQATARRIALRASIHQKIKELEEEKEQIQQKDSLFQDEKRLAMIFEQIKLLQKRKGKIPFIDEFDLRYNLHVKVPQPSSKAVMFCIMDVSGSMNQSMKDMAKRFFILLYLFLKRNYQKIEVVFIRHHTSAKEVDEHEFFYSRETGGTIVSSALKMMNEVITARYNPSEWNIYGAQASDGDNWNDDSPLCRKILTENILPLVQYFAYVEINARRPQALWREYKIIEESFSDYFSMQQIGGPQDIYPVFRELFQKKSRSGGVVA